MTRGLLPGERPGKRKGESQSLENTSNKNTQVTRWGPALMTSERDLFYTHEVMKGEEVI